MGQESESAVAGGAVAFGLEELPPNAQLRSVTAVSAEVAGRRALRVQLTDAVARDGVPDVDYHDAPTFVLIPVDFENGTIEVDVLGRLTPTAPDHARGFVGIAYRVDDDAGTFEAVYLRPLNGRKVHPPAPRDARAVQYFAYPDGKYQRLRDEYPDGRYEVGADIGPDEWISLRLDIDGPRVEVGVDDTSVLTLTETKGTPAAGAIGLWVDIGTEAYFSNLVVTPRPTSQAVLRRRSETTARISRRTPATT
jgi:hypothetical protein